MGWSRTFAVPSNGVYQVMLPFLPGEWEKAPVTGKSFAVVKALHPPRSPWPTQSGHVADSVFLVRYMLDATTSSQTITDTDVHADTISALATPPVIEVNQAAGWLFQTVAADWTTTNTGFYAKQTLQKRLVNATPNTCEYGVWGCIEYWKGVEIRREIRITASQPSLPIQTNFPIIHFKVGGVAVTTISNESFGDGMSYVHRVDTVKYAVVQEYPDHCYGPARASLADAAVSGVANKMKADAAKYVTLKGASNWHLAGEDWGHPDDATSTGQHDEFCLAGLPHISRAIVTPIADPPWPHLHELASEYFASPYHFLEDATAAPVRKINHLRQWSTRLGEGRGSYPRFGKASNADKPNTRGRKTEDASHLQCTTMDAVLRLCPTPAFEQEILEYRAQWVLFMDVGPQAGGEERADHRLMLTIMSILPFATGELRSDLIIQLNSKYGGVLTALRKFPDGRPYSQRGSRKQWIEGKDVWLTWQFSMLLGGMWKVANSGYVERKAADVNTIQHSAEWMIKNGWSNQNPVGQWHVPYAQAVDRTKTSWGSSLFWQAMGGLQSITEKAVHKATIASILQFTGGNPSNMARWWPITVDPITLTDEEIHLLVHELENAKKSLLKAYTTVDRELKKAWFELGGVQKQLLDRLEPPDGTLPTAT